MAEESKTASLGRLDELTAKYKTDARQEAHKAFDSRTLSEEKIRISSSPQTERFQGNIGDLHKRMGEIQLELIDLADEYGKLSVTFGNFLGEKRIYTMGDGAKIALYSLLKNKKAVRDVKSKALGKRGDSLEILVIKMAEIAQDCHQKSIEGRDKSYELQGEVVAHIKYLNEELIRNLQGGNYKASDEVEAKLEAAKIEKELKELEIVLLDYEAKIKVVRGEGDLDKVRKLTDEMYQVLEMQKGVLDGKIAADNVVSEIRRQILDSAEGVESSKGAIAASRVNYLATNALIDSYNELEIKYRHARDHFIPVFLHQAKIAGMGMEALDLKNALIKMANVSQRLMQENKTIIKVLAEETFDLLKTQLYDPVKARSIEDEINKYMTRLNEMKMEWAEATTTVKEVGEKARHVVPR